MGRKLKRAVAAVALGAALAGGTYYAAHKGYIKPHHAIPVAGAIGGGYAASRIVKKKGNFRKGSIAAGATAGALISTPVIGGPIGIPAGAIALATHPRIRNALRGKKKRK